jgi:hypothetical protein
MIDYLPLVLTGIGLIVAIIYYTLTLRNSNKTQQLQLETRQAQLFMQIYNNWYSLELSRQYEKVMNWEWIDYEDFDKNIGSDIENVIALRMVGRFFEGIGLYVKRGLIDVSLVDDLMSGAYVRFWLKFQPIFAELRIRQNFPQMLEWIEYLYNELKPIVETQHPELK